MGKGARECRTETERSQHAEKEDDVSRRSKENCRSTTSAMGEGEGCPEEVRVRDQPQCSVAEIGRSILDRLLQDVIEEPCACAVVENPFPTERRSLKGGKNVRFGLEKFRFDN
jgi:hypothetical protein